MQIVIDIPEEIIKDAKESPNYYPSYLFGTIWKSIANGTVLPKGHGNCQPSRKGHWIIHEHPYVDWDSERCECSICHDTSMAEHKFCPHCGADMRGVE